MPVVIPTAIKTASTSYIMLTLGIIVMNTFHFILSLSYHSKTDCLNQSEGAKKDKVDGKFPVSIPDKTHTLNSKLTSWETWHTSSGSSPRASGRSRHTGSSSSGWQRPWYRTFTSVILQILNLTSCCSGQCQRSWCCCPQHIQCYILRLRCDGCACRIQFQPS